MEANDAGKKARQTRTSQAMIDRERRLALRFLRQMMRSHYTTDETVVATTAVALALISQRVAKQQAAP
jgi:hypothetical protein